MSSTLISIITAADPVTRDQSLDAFAQTASTGTLLAECEALEAFRHGSGNLYERVRACFFLYALHRFHLPAQPGYPGGGQIPFDGYAHLLERRFEEAVATFRQTQAINGPSDALSSALAAAYHRIAFQTLAGQVRRSVRSVRGNQWMFRVGHPGDQPLRVRPELLHRPSEDAAFPILQERTPVRMDLTHSAWSDIFFLGMDYPEGARVLNVSIDLGVHGRDLAPKPPVEAYFRMIDEPVLRLSSVDLGATTDMTDLAEVFDFARDYLGLLKAALIASGLVPAGMEGSEQRLTDLLHRLAGPGRGIELISSVNGIPKGSRLAVSTNLLAALIAVCMRATGQIGRLEGPLEEGERRLVAARAILGEWLAGSGGGWQDSGGVWPGIKLIQGQEAEPGDPEHGLSRGRLLPTHHILTDAEASPETRQKLQDSLVLVHGGMAQNVGPILEMVTEKYLLRSPAEWSARQDVGQILEAILSDLAQGDIAALGAATTRNFFGPLQTIIPWAGNLLHRDPDFARRARPSSARTSGASGCSAACPAAAWASSSRRRAKPKRRSVCRRSCRRRGGDWSTRCRLRWSRWSMISPSMTNGNLRRTLLPARGAAAPRLLRLTLPRLSCAGPAHSSPPARRAELDAFGAACRDASLNSAAWCRPFLTGCCPAPNRRRRGTGPLNALLANQRLRPASSMNRSARTCKAWPHRAGTEPPAGQQRVIRDVEPGDVLDGGCRA